MGYGRQGLSDRVRVSGTDFDSIRELIHSRPDQVAQNVADELEEVGKQAVQDMRETVETSVTKTGQEAQARGLRNIAGRVRGAAELKNTKRPRIANRSMIDSINYKVTKNKRNVSLRFGWITGRPGYALFQEEGTSNGVKGMHALTDARNKADIEIQRIIG